MEKRRFVVEENGMLYMLTTWINVKGVERFKKSGFYKFLIGPANTLS